MKDFFKNLNERREQYIDGFGGLFAGAVIGVVIALILTGCGIKPADLDAPTTWRTHVERHVPDSSPFGGAGGES